jgi:ABC-2 type transport system ATP-binding protein
MSDDIAICVKHVSKNFKLPHEKADSVKSLFTSPFNKDRKKVEVQHALRDISFDVKKGEFFGIVGRNGSGKSTLLKIIAGIYQPNKGEVSVNGKLVPFIELGVGFNPQLTGRENVYLNGALLGFSEKEVDAKYSAIVDFAELDRFMDQKLKNYSSGMQVRLAFSVATMLAESDVLLVDEVLAVGDADFQRKCFDYFKKLKKLKKTVIFVSHDMLSVREYCNRAILINDGKIAKQGEVGKIATAYTKLFTSEDAQEKTYKSTGKRWGDNEMKIKSVKFDKNKYSSNDEFITIDVKFQANKYVTNPVFGMLVKNSGGVVLLGANTRIQHVHTGSFKKNATGNIMWKIPNLFNDGNYTIDVAIAHEDAITQYDWWEDVEKFTVYKEDHSSFMIEPPIEVSLGR